MIEMIKNFKGFKHVGRDLERFLIIWTTFNLLSREECSERKEVNRNHLLNDFRSFKWISICWVEKSAVNEKKWTEIVH